MYNPKRGDCKLAQLSLLLANLDKIAFKKTKTINNKIIPVYHPTILCGDFNCAHDSKIYEFLYKSKLNNYDRLSRNNISGQYEKKGSSVCLENPLLPEILNISDQSQYKDEVEKRLKIAEGESEQSGNLEAYCSYGSNYLRHTFDFQSVYNHYDENHTPEVTTCVDEEKRIVDFIFYHSEDDFNNNQSEKIEFIDEEDEDEDEGESRSVKREADCASSDDDENGIDLKLVARLKLFNVEDVAGVSLPNKDYPSDHFLLAAKFILN